MLFFANVVLCSLLAAKMGFICTPRTRHTPCTVAGPTKKRGLQKEQFFDPFVFLKGTSFDLRIVLQMGYNSCSFSSTNVRTTFGTPLPHFNPSSAITCVHQTPFWARVFLKGPDTHVKESPGRAKNTPLTFKEKRHVSRTREMGEEKMSPATTYRGCKLAYW